MTKHLPAVRIAALALVQAGCAAAPPVVIDSACTAFGVIHPSRADTIGTKRQILVHNSVWRELCGGEK